MVRVSLLAKQAPDASIVQLIGGSVQYKLKKRGIVEFLQEDDIQLVQHYHNGMVLLVPLNEETPCKLVEPNISLAVCCETYSDARVLTEDLYYGTK